MASEELPHFFEDFFAESPSLPRACKACERPTSTCLCDALPKEPLVTKTRVVVLQHPMEAAKRLSTVPLLSKVLLQTETFLGRRFRVGSDPMLHARLRGAGAEYLSAPHGLLEDGENPLGSPSAASENGNCSRSSLCGGLRCLDPGEGMDGSGLGRGQQRLVLLLFPGPNAKDLSQLAQEVPGFRSLEKTLVVIDGTWQHAREMFRSLEPHLPGSVTQVQLPSALENSSEPLMKCPGGLLMRKEPKAGFVSTSEAVARALFFCEPDGACVRDAILAPLKKMVAFQAARNPAMAAKQAVFEGG
ncbi:hypothetical protein KFL_004050030 [Klebsormidium nitens]|uniref:tRNA-uridine aminocarboxypropyltransferase n=1 Tax=Klebsormidium nitens TaxID=105231 RepID=A0A1Y1IFB8_KLENI|nr:hypothetical protein KFL_004050030 [Klebsormidium nitens]|eukprot:GAQ88159.1 hypothetical protein KFL_004050030 [Klebsormidium nitens]